MEMIRTDIGIILLFAHQDEKFAGTVRAYLLYTETRKESHTGQIDLRSRIRAGQ